MDNEREETQNPQSVKKRRRHPLDSRQRKAKLLEWYLYELRDIADTDQSKAIPCGLATAKIMTVLNQVHEQDYAELLKKVEEQLQRYASHIERLEAQLQQRIR